MRCPDCNRPVVVLESLLGGYARVRCTEHGTTTAVDRAPAPLPAHGLARRSDPGTSRAAAAAVDPRGHHAALLEALQRIGEGTRDEIAGEAGIDEWAASKRLSELERAGYIVETGAIRPGNSGRGQRVMRAVRSEVQSA